MPKAIIDQKESVTVTFSNDTEKQQARIWLWEYLKCKQPTTTVIKKTEHSITAELVAKAEINF
jgi:hypothetical protein